MRFVAALMVTVSHTAHLWGLHYWPQAEFAIGLGPAGVDLFFVISGFVISLSASDSSNDRLHVTAEFVRKRITRIFPIYWFAFAIYFFAEQYLPAMAANNPGASVILSLFLLTDYNSAIPAAWTLAYEMMFYAFAAAMIWVPGTLSANLVRAGAAYVCLIGIAWLTGHTVYMLTNPVILNFVMGCLCAWLFQKRAHVLPWVAFSLGWIALLVGSYFFAKILGQPANWWRPLLLGVPSALIIYGAAGLATRGVGANRFAVYLGNASYSLYLWHYLVLCIFTWAIGDAFSNLPITSLTLSVALCVMAGLASYRYIEKPLLRLNGIRLPSSRPRGGV